MAKRKTSSHMPLVLIGLGLGAAYLATRPAAPVSGMGHLGFVKKLKKAVKKAAGQAKKVGQTVARIDPSMKLAKTVVTKVAAKTKSPLAKALVKNVSIASKPKPPKPVAQPGGGTVYQDENGNTITQAEYERRMAEYAAAQAAAAVPAAHVSKPAYQPPVAPTIPHLPSAAELLRQAPSSSSYIETGSSSGTVLPPAASTPVPSIPAQAAPAKGNPVMTIAAFAAIPLVLGLTGGK